MFGLSKKKAADGPPQPGAFGQYQLHELINTGGMAELWLATNSAGKVCAVRRLHEHLRSDSTSRKRFISGCEILEKVSDHDCIISYMEHGKTDGIWYCAMDYVEGANLKERFARHDPVLLENVAQILIDMATGLEHIHENGFMHLDFKPENVIVSSNGAVRLVDFDLAMQIPEEPFVLKKNPGTPAYMSPEQLSGQPIDQRVDIFAFGVTAYELLTNQKPFPGETAAEILNNQMNRSNFLAPREHNPDLPLNLQNIVLKCIEREPNLRYPFLSVLVRDLKSALYVS